MSMNSKTLVIRACIIPFLALSLVVNVIFIAAGGFMNIMMWDLPRLRILLRNSIPTEVRTQTFVPVSKDASPDQMNLPILFPNTGLASFLNRSKTPNFRRRAHFKGTTFLVGAYADDRIASAPIITITALLIPTKNCRFRCSTGTQSASVQCRVYQRSRNPICLDLLLLVCPLPWRHRPREVLLTDLTAGRNETAVLPIVYPVRGSKFKFSLCIGPLFAPSDPIRFPTASHLLQLFLEYYLHVSSSSSGPTSDILLSVPSSRDWIKLLQVARIEALYW